MKQIILFVTLFISYGVFAQNEVLININHKLADADFGFNQEAANNNGVAFNVDRLEYYLSNFILIHDGGMQTSVSDLYALVDVGDNTQISLGDVTFTEIEGIKFSVGVDQAANHLDPASYDQTHPLAPKNPSMHWGWTSGYRFVAMEGNGGSSLSTLYEIHALGDQNYFEVTVMASAEMEGNIATINLDADYTMALKNIDISTGVITHGDYDEAVDLLNNFRTDVFKASPDDIVIIDSTTSITNTKIGSLSVYPNPTSSNFSINLEDFSNAAMLVVYNTLGAKVKELNITKSTELVEVDRIGKGLYFLNILNREGVIIANSSVILE